MRRFLSYSQVKNSECDPLIGGGGIAVSYVADDGTNNTFSTLCEIEPLVKAVAVTVDSLADELVIDCTEEIMASRTPVPGSPAETEPASSEQ